MKSNVVQPLNLTKAFAVLKGVNENQVRAKIIEGVVVKFTLNSSLKTNQTLYANILPPQKTAPSTRQCLQFKYEFSKQFKNLRH